MADGGALADLSVVITRPARQGDALAERLRDAGADATIIPLLAITPLEDAVQCAKIAFCLQALPDIDVAIFVSRNAAEQLLQALAVHGVNWPDTITTIAVGNPTAQFLCEHGIATISPDRMDSEGMLALPSLQAVQGKRCVIFRGLGGRETTAQTLRERGASVDYCELYRRTLPDAAAAAWQRWINDGQVRKLACVNSVETLNHLLQIDPQAALRDNLTLVVPGGRVTEQARRAGLLRVCTAVDATDNSVFQTITHWYCT